MKRSGDRGSGISSDVERPDWIAQPGLQISVVDQHSVQGTQILDRAINQRPVGRSVMKFTDQRGSGSGCRLSRLGAALRNGGALRCPDLVLSHFLAAAGVGRTSVGERVSQDGE